MSVQTQDIKRPVHRVPAIIAFVLAGVFVVVGLLGAPAFYAFAAFSALCGLIWALGGGADGAEPPLHKDMDAPFPGGLDLQSQFLYGKR
jgi:hypothetical protein